MPYTPPQSILERYADVLVNFALGGGSGIKEDEVVRIVAPESAKPLYVELHRAVWRAGGDTIGHYAPDDDAAYNLSRDFIELAGERQLDFFPAKQARGLIDQMDHQVSVLSDADMHALEGADPRKIMRRAQAMKPLLDWRTEKENEGRFTWTLALYGTPAMAAEAGLSEEEYWRQIVEACFLDDDNAIERWRVVSAQIGDYVERLSALPIERLHVQGEDADLTLTVGEQRKWVGGSGRNIPSLRDLHEPRLARHGGVDTLQPAALSLWEPDRGHRPRVCERPRREGDGGAQ